MAQPELVRDCFLAMTESSNKPITVKIRLGINDGDKVSDQLDMLEIPKTKVAVERNGIVIQNSQLLTPSLDD